jgi:zinc transporter
MSTQPILRKPDPTYGSDEHGLVWGFRFVPDIPAQSVSAQAAAERMAAPARDAEKEFFWLHFSLANSAAEPWLQQNINLPDAFYDSLRGEVGATRLEEDANSLVAVIYDVLFDFTFDVSKVATTSLCIGPRLLVSARLRPLRSVDYLRAAVRAGEPFRSPVELLAHLLRDQASVLADIARQATGRVDQIEDRLLAERISANRSEIGNLRRVLVRLQRLLAPEPAALFRLLNRPPEWIAEEDVEELRQAAEEFSAAVNDSVALVERIKLIQEELIALVNEQTNRTLYVLTVVTVLALPINMVAGLFGMNVGGIPLAEHGHGFVVIALLLAFLTALLAYLAFRRRD